MLHLFPFSQPSSSRGNIFHTTQQFKGRTGWNSTKFFPFPLPPNCNFVHIFLAKNYYYYSKQTWPIQNGRSGWENPALHVRSFYFWASLIVRRVWGFYWKNKKGLFFIEKLENFHEKCWNIMENAYCFPNSFNKRQLTRTVWDFSSLFCMVLYLSLRQSTSCL